MALAAFGGKIFHRMTTEATELLSKPPSLIKLGRFGNLHLPLMTFGTRSLDVLQRKHFCFPMFQFMPVVFSLPRFFLFLIFRRMSRLHKRKRLPASAVTDRTTDFLERMRRICR